MSSLERANPETLGLSSAAILDFVNGIEAANLELHSLMILRHGKVAAEGWWAPYRKKCNHLLYSLSKSFQSSAIGIAVQEGVVNLDDSVLSFFPEEAPSAPSENLRAMKVRHLLSMATGHEVEPDIRTSGTWVQEFLAWPVPKAPGSHFLYNSLATFMLSAIIQKVTGITTLDYLRPRLLEPLGIENATWETNPEGITIGGWGMSITTEDIAKFGQLYLQKGVWEGKRLLSEEWIREATSKQVENGPTGNPDWIQGYGFQFWMGRHGSYRGDGAFGQYCLVLSEHEMVVAMTASVDDMQAVLNLVWDHLLPSQPTSSGDSSVLEAKLATLKLTAPAGSAFSLMADKVSDRTYKSTVESEFAGSCRFNFEGSGAAFSWSDEHGDHTVEIGYDDWAPSEGVPLRGKPSPAAAQGAWVSPVTFSFRILHREEPTHLAITARFAGDSVSIETRRGGTFMSPEGPGFEGTATK